MNFQPPVRVHTVEDVDTIYRVQQKCNLADPPYEKTLKVDGHPVKFESDSGASLIHAHESAIRRFPKLYPPQMGLSSATGNKMQVRGLYIADI